MPLSSFGNAMAASFQGQQLLAKLDQDKQETEQIKANTQMQQMQTMALQQKQKGQADLAQWMSANMQAQAAPGETAVDFAKKYTEGARYAGTKGNYEGMTLMMGMADKEVERAKDLRVEQAAKTQQSKEALATSAVQYLQNPTPEATKTLAQTALNAGVNPMSIPQPGTIEFSAWAKQQQTASMTGKEQLSFLEKQKEFDLQFQEKKAENQRRDEDRDAQRQQTAAIQQGNLALRAESLEFRKMMAGTAREDKLDKKATAQDAATFKQAEALNTKVQREAKPFLSDLQNVTQAKNLLSVNSATADQQLDQMLPSLLGNLKGRATNPYYKDNKNMGDAIVKLEGMFSRPFTGRRPEEQRKQIYEMLDNMERTALVPAILNLEKDQKKHAEKYNISPDLIEVQGDFDRTPRKKTKTMGRTAEGEVTEAPAKTAPTPGVATMRFNASTGKLEKVQ